MNERCTDHFPSLLHINILEDNERVSIISYGSASLQVLIPSMNFTRRGSISRLTVGAQWLTSLHTTGVTFTELQVWRETSDREFTKIAQTSPMIETANTDGVYQDILQNPIEFEEGDVFGFYQSSRLPNANILLRASTENCTPYYTSACNADQPPTHLVAVETSKLKQ